MILCSLAFALAAPAAVPAPLRVGELEPASISVAGPYEKAFGAEARTFRVSFPEATYIRVHFAKFDLAPGDWLTIASPDGLESYTFTGRGPNGTGEFWASSVLGDTAVVRLQAAVGGGGGFEIDSFGRGTADLVPDLPGPGAGTESECGTTDWEDAKCRQGTTEYDRAKGVALELIGCCSACTAFKVSDSGQFLTNNHCISSQSGVNSTELRFYYETSGCGGTASYSGSVVGGSFLATNGTLDYTLFRSSGDTSSIPCLPLDPRLPPVGEGIYIAGHPYAGPKKLSIRDTTKGQSGLCAVDASPYPGNDSTSDVGYYCDTAGGSSGSPVLSAQTQKVVALHHFGGCLNSGVRIDRIYGQISGLLDTCSGGGGQDPVCGNGVRESGEACDGSDFGTDSCQARGFDAGSLSCTSSCTVDASGCFDLQCKGSGASCVDNSECCSGNCKGKPGRRTCK